jgi:phosphatidylinositol 4-kinase type 2
MEEVSTFESAREDLLTLLSFPFGWLFLPVDLIGRPFSQKTRDHFLPLLTSTQWWSQTQLALRRAFQIDPDFQERMFARQIAVMKGQAWNVVETLKTPDHGPLELTRRAKVCVWDDLVDVPVAVPMRLTSSEMRRRAETDYFTENIQEEMDIGAAGSTVGNGNAPAVDLLSLTTPPADLPHPGRFEMSSSITLPEEPSSAPGGSGPSSLNGGPVSASVPTDGHPQPGHPTAHHGGRPQLPRTSLSHGPPRSLNMYSPDRQREHQRRFSFATAAGRRNSNSIAAQLYGGDHGRASHEYVGDDDELEGDLGYAAAEGMEGNRRKVIVERLEPVKSKNPVFTWC